MMNMQAALDDALGAEVVALAAAVGTTAATVSIHQVDSVIDDIHTPTDIFA